MSDKIRVLQLGNRDWSSMFQLPEYLDFTFCDKFDTVPKYPYDIVFAERLLSDEEIRCLFDAIKAHTLFYTDCVQPDKKMQWLYNCKKGKILNSQEIPYFLQNEARNYFPKPYGEKFKFNNLGIAHGFGGSVKWNAYYSVTLNGEYGEEYNQIAYWRNNIPVFQGQAIDFWLEYNKDPQVEVQLVVTQFRNGTLSQIQQSWTFTQEELDDVVTIDNPLPTGPVFVSLMAKGSGKLEIIALHDRYSRRGHGVFLPGGERFVASNREEVFYYFDPGDMKPPLNVYFSGYKTMQGFEGYNMMRKMGCPYLLIAEPRLEGGGFYMGTPEYEQGIADIIRKHMQELGFDHTQVILSGLSMGTYGALYYGCDIRPHAMILGKPLASIGDIAENERLHRPGGFPTSLDVLNYNCGDMDDTAIKEMNARFWDKFDAADFTSSKFIVSYMIEDDYDMRAYDMIISHLKSEGVQIYGKGIHGRHNDATGAIASWFKKQYEQVLQFDFGRRTEE